MDGIQKLLYTYLNTKEKRYILTVVKQEAWKSQEK
jgi:hypothetical protein